MFGRLESPLQSNHGYRMPCTKVCLLNRKRIGKRRANDFYTDYQEPLWFLRQQERCLLEGLVRPFR